MDNNKDKIVYIPVEDILPNRFQPRLAFDEKELNELAASISKYGIIQPIVLRSIGDKYEIIAGERRFKASQLAGLTKVAAIINNTDDNTSAEIALLENLQRKNLTPIEEAQSYRKLIDRGFTQEEIANKLGVSQSSIANKMRLLNLPKRVQDSLLYGKISERHARSLLSLNNVDLQLNLLQRIIDERLTVKQTEEEIALLLNKDKHNNDIPTEIQRFLSRTSDYKPVIEKNEEHISSVSGSVESKPSFDTGSEHLNELLKKEVEKIELNNEVVNIPEVVTIDENKNIEEKIFEPIPSEIKPEIKIYEQNITEINPFQENSISVIERLPINNVSDINREKLGSLDTMFEINEDIEEEIILEEKVVDTNSLIYNDGSVNMPKVINKVRDFVSSLDELKGLISTTELDLNGKYQIIIEIDNNN